MKVMSFFFFPFKVYGEENIPKEGGCILASNHQSYLDPILIPISIHRRLNFVAKEELFKNIILRLILVNLDSIPIKRGTSDIRAIKEIVNRISNGGAMVIFPEGTRTLNAAERNIEEGVGFVAHKTKVPIVPVYINGSGRVLPKGAKFFKRQLITITYGKPVYFTEKRPYGDIAKSIMNEILTLGGEQI